MATGMTIKRDGSKVSKNEQKQTYNSRQENLSLPFVSDESRQKSNSQSIKKTQQQMNTGVGARDKPVQLEKLKSQDNAESNLKVGKNKETVGGKMALLPKIQEEISTLGTM